MRSSTITRFGCAMKIIGGICRFCGCTEPAPCMLDTPEGDVFPCGWVDQDQDLCSNPECVELAYREACASLPQNVGVWRIE